MSPSSSISSSEAGRWLACVAAATLAVLAAICLVNWLGVRHGLVGWKSTQLERVQIRKIEAAPGVDVVLLGDSTLGNAIDARAWSEATGLRVLSVPLTGQYGYEGSLNMLRRVLRRHRPAIVVVMQAFDMPTRNLSWEGLLFTAERWSDLAGAPPWELVPPLANLDLTGGMLQALGRPDKPVLFDERGFVPQALSPARRRVALEPAEILEPSEIRPEKQLYLREIGAVCRRTQARCVYLHGPYPKPACEGSRAYLAAANRFVRAAGLVPAPGTPACLPPQDIGDSEDHVLPEAKPRYSEVYRMAAARVAPALARSGTVTVQRSRPR
jgi:hypothetical protein